MCETGSIWRDECLDSCSIASPKCDVTHEATLAVPNESLNSKKKERKKRKKKEKNTDLFLFQYMYINRSR